MSMRLTPERSFGDDFFSRNSATDRSRSGEADDEVADLAEEIEEVDLNTEDQEYALPEIAPNWADNLPAVLSVPGFQIE